ncbi:MAG: MaoC family dehydratase N-terminal domain-containing protein [Rhodobacteraceae bacterium]|nr:MaoC family dehydratase N-terminal domain-containing protein [Paracoccaceae bacterium]
MTVETTDWIGKQREASETVSDRQLREFRSTLSGILGDETDLPGVHWCLVPEICAPSDLGSDGHPKVGLFLPDLDLPRRMWAGGRVAYRGGVRTGETVTRVSTIRDIKFKEGRSGKLGFVTLDHRYSCGQHLRIVEEQNIVYRQAPSSDAPAAVPPQAPRWDAGWTIEALPTSTLLFRYSAMTFNGHRIHYDRDYAMGVEGYNGLVVHGPLQATWMQILATRIFKRLPQDFSYRGLSPLTCDRPVTIEAKEGEAGGLDLRVRDVELNVVTMEAQAR